MALDPISDSVSSSSPPANLASTGGAMTVREFCEWARIGRTTLYSEVNADRLILRKAGAKSLILRSDAEAWLHALPTVTVIEELDRSPKAKSGKLRRSTSDVEDRGPARAGSDLRHQGADLDGEPAQ